MSAFQDFCQRRPELASQLVEACAGDRAAAEAVYLKAFTAGFEEGHEQAVLKERGRCVAHLELGLASGRLDIAERAIDAEQSVDVAYLEHVAASPTGSSRVQFVYNVISRGLSPRLRLV